MNIHSLKPNEREAVKLTKHFSKRAEKLIKAGKLSPEHQQVSESCEKLADQIFAHGSLREQILQKREKLAKIVQDNAACPKCGKNSHLKLVGTAQHEKGWKSNKYKYRRCNLSFTWNRPNNPWDMVRFMQNYVEELSVSAHNDALPDEARQQAASVIGNLEQNIAQLQPVLAQSDQEYEEMNQRDAEMTRMLHDVKSHLLIEKIKMDAWQID